MAASSVEAVALRRQAAAGEHLWLLATLENVGSARRLEQLCREHDAYRWLCGGVHVNHHTLSDFRVTHERALDDLMTQLIAALVELDLVKADRISQDSLRVPAAAGSSSFRREKTLRRLLEEARAHVEAVKQQADEAPADAARRVAAQQRAAQERLQRVEAALAGCQSCGVRSFPTSLRLVGSLVKVTFTELVSECNALADRRLKMSQFSASSKGVSGFPDRAAGWKACPSLR